MATEKVILTSMPPVVAGLERYRDKHALPWHIHLPVDLRSELHLGLLDKVDAVVHLCGDYDSLPQIVDLVQRRSIPAVIGHFAGMEGLNPIRLFVDDAAIGAMAATHLHEAGYRGVVLIGNDSGPPIRERRFAACQAACANLGLACWRITPETIPGGGSSSAAEAESALVAHLRNLPGPLAAFFHQDQAADWFRNVCLYNGFQVPESLGILGVDDAPRCVSRHPTLSSVQTPYGYLGYRAGLELHRQFSGHRPPTEPIILHPLRVVARESTALRKCTGDALVDGLIADWAAAAAPSVAQLLSRTEVSSPTLRRRFLAATGLPPRRWFVQRQLDRFAADLVASGDDVADLVARHGFGTRRSLERQFRQRFGLSPGEFRSRARLH